MTDTVKNAEATPDLAQPYAELGLAPDEYATIIQVLGRRPTECELAMYSIMWSEHCSYKSSKVHLRQFAELPKGDRMLVGMGENAGVVDVGEGLAVTFKVESHNHPSYVEPYQGAATGIGGIVRDILTMGARPVLVMDPLRFGDADHPDTARVLPGIVAGIVPQAAHPLPDQFGTGLGAGQRRRQPAFGHHIQPVANFEKLFKLFADHQHRTARAGQAQQLATYLRGGPHVNAPGRLRDDQQFRPGINLAAHDEFLQVAT